MTETTQATPRTRCVAALARTHPSALGGVIERAENSRSASQALARGLARGVRTSDVEAPPERRRDAAGAQALPQTGKKP